MAGTRQSPAHLPSGFNGAGAAAGGLGDGCRRGRRGQWGRFPERLCYKEGDGGGRGFRGGEKYSRCSVMDRLVVVMMMMMIMIIIIIIIIVIVIVIIIIIIVTKTTTTATLIIILLIIIITMMMMMTTRLPLLMKGAI